MSDRKKILEAFRKSIGPEVSFTLGEQRDVEYISSGVRTLDIALGGGQTPTGFARGYQHLSYGPPGAGKSALVYQTIATLQAQDPNALACIIDIEHMARVEWLKLFGVDPDRVEIIYSSSTQEASEHMQKAIRSGVFDIIALDSIGALPDRKEIDGSSKKKGGDIGDPFTASMGAAKDIGRMVRVTGGELSRKLAAYQNGADVIVPAVFYVNQVRANMGGYGGFDFSGGWALKHGLITYVRVSERKGEGDIIMGTIGPGIKGKVGALVQAIVERNKLAPANKTASYWFVNTKCPEHPFGIDNVRGSVDTLISNGLIIKGGSWCTIVDPETGEEIKKLQGAAQVTEYMRENPELLKQLEDKLLEIGAVEHDE